MDSLRLLMISHDNNGVSKTSRAMKIATHLSENLADCSILVLTDLSIIGKFRFPQNVDFVHLPGVEYKSRKEFRAKNLNIGSENALRIRRKIVQSTAKTFKPHYILVEADLNKLSVAEIYKTLRYMKESLPQTKIIWGLPDVLGNPVEVRRIWTRFKINAAFEKVVDEIWVYGCEEIFDFIKAYRMPSAMSDKLIFTGYIKSPMLSSRKVSREIARKNFKKPFVLLNAGSGLDAFHLIDSFVRFLEREGENIPFHSLIITGPMMLTREKHVLMERISKLSKVSIRRFCKQVLEYMKYADLILSTGGYNTLCEIMSYRKKAIVVPNGGAFNEHIARAELFEKNGLIQLLPPRELSPERLGEMITSTISKRKPLSLRKKPIEFPMHGLSTIVERLKDTNGVKQYTLKQAVS
ncbi:MAG: glycosyltransferase family protein [bacterium]